MGFIILLILTSLSIAGSAAFFSVYGLAKIFSGAFLPVVIMATSLEVGKLVGASFLYRYWKTISKIIKVYLIAAVVGLMLITSLGIFGFLSAANNTTLLPYQQQTQQISTLESHISDIQRLKAERLSREEQINKQIADLPSTSIRGRKQLITANQDELASLTSDVNSYTKDILDTQSKIAALKSQIIQTQGDVGPIVYISKAFNTDTITATKYLIFLIIFVFDPLAVILTIAANIALAEYKNSKVVKPIITPPVNLSPKTEVGVTKFSHPYNGPVLNTAVYANNPNLTAAAPAAPPYGTTQFVNVGGPLLTKQETEQELENNPIEPKQTSLDRILHR